MKRVAIMQPYFFPYLGYFSLVAAADQFIFFDTPQYIRHGWINRNRILKPSKEDWQYIIVPLEKHAQKTAIKDVSIKSTAWQSKILSQLEHYKKKAKYYSEVINLIKSVFYDNTSSQSIVGLNKLAIERTCEYCGIPFETYIFSEMQLDIKQVNAPDEWALEISKAIGAKTYLNPPGGKEFFDKEKYFRSDIALNFLHNNLKPYWQPNKEFIPGLSIIDALMFSSPSEVRDLVSDYYIS